MFIPCKPRLIVPVHMAYTCFLHVEGPVAFPAFVQQ